MAMAEAVARAVSMSARAEVLPWPKEEREFSRAVEVVGQIGSWLGVRFLVGAVSIGFVLGVAHLMIALLLMVYNGITPYA